MTRRLRVLLATVLAGLFCTSTLAQAPVLMPFPRDHPFSMGIFDGLRHRGFIEGKNLTIVYRDFAPHADLLSEYAAELVKAQVDLIYGGGGTATHAAQQATKTIPILGFAEDMVGEGLVTPAKWKATARSTASGLKS